MFQSCYYKILISEIFREINMRSHDSQPRYLSIGYKFPRTRNDKDEELILEFCELSIGNALIATGSESDIKELKSRVEKSLLLDSNLQQIVQQYNQLKYNLDTNQKRNEFFENIDNLWKKVFFEGESLNKDGMCKLCPLKPT
jgi:hypothetical protein